MFFMVCIVATRSGNSTIDDKHCKFLGKCISKIGGDPLEANSRNP